MQQLISEIIQSNVFDTIKNIFTVMSLLEIGVSPEHISILGASVVPHLPEDKIIIVTLTSEVLSCNKEELEDLVRFIIMSTNPECKGLAALAKAINMLEDFSTL